MIGKHLPAAILLLALGIAPGEGGDAWAAKHGKPSGAKAKEAAAPQTTTSTWPCRPDSEGAFDFRGGR